MAEIQEEEEEDPIALYMNLDEWPFLPDDQDDIDDFSSSSLTNHSQSSETNMPGYITVKIVKLQGYPCTVSSGEMVCFERELNDANAIKVLNTRSIQVGHIQETTAKILAPLIDQDLTIVKGTVQDFPREGDLNSIPCRVYVSCRIVDFGNVKRKLSRCGLHLVCKNDDPVSFSDSVFVKEDAKNEDGTSVDDIFKLFDGNVSKQGIMELKEPPKSLIKLKLLLHQKQALSWLVQRENSRELPPFWEETDGGFFNVLTNHWTPNCPKPIRGGIFADDRGSGKTITLLSLIALENYDMSNSERSNKWFDGKNLVDVGVPKSKRVITSNRAGNNSCKRLKTEDHELGISRKNNKTTLIVFPPSVLPTWKTQIEEDTKLKAYLYHGEQRTNNALDLLMYDIVLTTYPTLYIEHLSSPIFEIEWSRVILDEAHLIKTVGSGQSQAVRDLKTKRRWVVTGTPIQNGSMDLFPLMFLLKLEPFSIRSYWDSLVQELLEKRDKEGLSRLQVLISTMSLRRTKDKISDGLLPKSIETCVVDLSSEERKDYDEMETNAKNVVRSYLSPSSAITNYTKGLRTILRLLQICTNLDLCLEDRRGPLSSNRIDDVAKSPKLMEKLISVVEDEKDDCPICISKPTDIVITRCAHIFCKSCILTTLEFGKTSCPMCRHQLSESDIFSSKPNKTNNSNASSKVTALIKDLSAARKQNPNVKSVIFSQFPKMLILLEEPLKAAGFKILRLDGSMNGKKWVKVIKEFGVPTPDGPTILLASLKASGTGINLTAASRVYLLEPWLSPAAEEQAINCVHRIGQKEKVTIVRMIARNTIDKRILELQEKRKKLARDPFGRKGTKKERKEANKDDLCTLMSL